MNEREARVFRWFNDRSDRMTLPVWVVMQSGSLGAVVVGAGVVAGRRRLRSAGLTALYGASIWGGVKLVKPLVGRGRPEAYLDGVDVRGRRQVGLGYPSGHAAVSAALALMLPSALGDRHRPARTFAALGLGGVAGAARMYVGAHLPLDVVGGLAIGLVTGDLARRDLDRR